MDFHALLRNFCESVEQKDGHRLASLFTEDGVYHDVFYGAFEGRGRIARMIPDCFYKTAIDFRWDMHDPVCNGQTLYARYTFSYRSLLPEARGGRYTVYLYSHLRAPAGHPYSRRRDNRLISVVPTQPPWNHACDA